MNNTSFKGSLITFLCLQSVYTAPKKPSGIKTTEQAVPVSATITLPIAEEDQNTVTTDAAASATPAPAPTTLVKGEYEIVGYVRIQSLLGENSALTEVRQAQQEAAKDLEARAQELTRRSEALLANHKDFEKRQELLSEEKKRDEQSALIQAEMNLANDLNNFHEYARQKNDQIAQLTMSITSEVIEEICRFENKNYPYDVIVPLPYGCNVRLDATNDIVKVANERYERSPKGKSSAAKAKPAAQIATPAAEDEKGELKKS